MWSGLTVVAWTFFVSSLTFLYGNKMARIHEIAVYPLTNHWSTAQIRRRVPAYYGGGFAWDNVVPMLRAICGPEWVDFDPDELARHGMNEWQSYLPGPLARTAPNVVVYPENTEQISDVMRVAHKYKIPVIPYAGGTSLEGHISANRGGICIDFARMDKVVAVHEDDLDVVVQPGVGWEELNAELEGRGLWFPPDPGPGAKIGGMIGTGCSGTNAGRYGTMKDWVINLTVVLADGTIIKTRRRPRYQTNGKVIDG